MKADKVMPEGSSVSLGYLALKNKEGGLPKQAAIFITKIQLLKGAAGMNTLKAQGEKNISPKEPYHFRKRLGSTTFLVAVHSSKTNTETANDKIARLIRHDTTMRKVVNQ